MRKITLLFISTFIGITGVAQRTLDLNTLKMEKEMKSSLPSRSVEATLGGVRVTYHFNNINLLDDPIFQGASMTKIEGFWPNNEVGEPSFLSRWDTFVVPDKNATVALVDSSYIEYNLMLSPARPILSNNNYEAYSRENVKPIKKYIGYLPSSVISATRQNSYRNQDLLEVCISPIQYDSEKKKVKVFKEIVYEIHYNSPLSGNKSVKDDVIYDDPFLSNVTVNASQWTSMVPKTASTGASWVNKEHYLIVTVPKYSEAANRLAEWKRVLGFKVHVAMQPYWTTSSVKDSVMSAYNTNNTAYLLIIGGHNDVPAQISHLMNTHVTDLYYGCVGTGYTPSIHRGRLLVNTASDANVVVDKIISYEKNPVTIESMYNTGVHCAFFDNGTPSGYEARRYVLTSERIRDYMLQLGKTVRRVYYAFPTVSPTNWNNSAFANGEAIPTELRRPWFAWDGDSTDITSYINQKAFYVLYRGHGDVQNWYAPHYTTNNIETLSNGAALPVVFSICCSTGKFDEAYCFCEAFLRKENGGCVAIFGSTEDGATAINDVLAEGMFDAIWPTSALWPSLPGCNVISNPAPTPTYRLGQILDQGLRRAEEAFLGTSLSTYSKHIHELYHCFGDPSMMIHTNTPTSFANASIQRLNGTIYVDTGGEMATITYHNKQTGSSVSYYGTSHTYPDNPKLTICISAHNKIPYIDDGTLYIQNQSFASDSHHENDIIKVGNSVTSTLPQGDVNFLQGTHVLKGNSIELYPGTKVSVGAVLDVSNY